MVYKNREVGRGAGLGEWLNPGKSWQPLLYDRIERDEKELTLLTPMRSDAKPHSGHAISATSSSAKPNVPTALPTAFSRPSRSVMTNETDELMKTRKEIENKQTPKRYDSNWTQVAENMTMSKSASRVPALCRDVYLAKRTVLGLTLARVIALLRSVIVEEGRWKWKDSVHLP